MAMTGDFRALHELAANIDHLATSEFRIGLAFNLGEEALSQVEEGFRNQRDPYGESWPKSLRAQLGGQTLTEKATLRRSFSRGGVDATADGFQIGTNVPYALAHQKGVTIKAKAGGALAFRLPTGTFVLTKSVTLPKRQIIPEDTLGPIWGKAFQEAAEAYVEAQIDQ